jgi:colicin import membrane protein
VFALLSLISDPGSAQARLKELTDKAVEAQAAAEAAKAENEKVQQARKQAEDALAQTNAAIRQLADKDNDLKVREAKLASGVEALYQREQALTAAKAVFDKSSAEASATLDSRAQALQKAEEEQATRFKQQQKDIEAILASKTAAIQAEYAQRLDNAKSIEDSAKRLQAETRQRAIDAAKAAADQAAALYESKVAELRSLGG